MNNDNISIALGNIDDEENIGYLPTHSAVDSDESEESGASDEEETVAE